MAELGCTLAIEFPCKNFSYSEWGIGHRTGQRYSMTECYGYICVCVCLIQLLVFIFLDILNICEENIIPQLIIVKEIYIPICAYWLS